MARAWPRVVADDNLSPPTRSVRRRSSLPRANGHGPRFALREDRVLPSVPEHVLSLEMEDEVGLLANLLTIVVLHSLPR